MLPFRARQQFVAVLGNNLLPGVWTGLKVTELPVPAPRFVKALYHSAVLVAAVVQLIITINPTLYQINRRTQLSLQT